MTSDAAPAALEETPSAQRAAVPFGFLCAALLLPLLVLPETYIYPFVATKSFALFAIVPAAVVAYAGLHLVRAAPPLRRPGPVLLGAAAFLASAALSTVAGVDPRLGLWDGGERMIGIVTLVAFGTWMVLALACARDDARWLMLVRVSLAAGCVAAVVAVLEGTQIVDRPSDGRAVSTLGQAAYVGSLGLHIVFAGLALGAASTRRGDVWFGRVAAVLGVAAIVASVTRASGVGLVLGGAVCAAWRFGPRLSGRRRAFAAVLGAAALAGAFVLVRTSALVREVPILARLADVTPSHATAGSRLLAWDAALDAARDRPLLGWGFNSFGHAFDVHYPARLLRYGANEAWFDDAHGIVFNVLAEQGVVGLAALAAMFAAAFLALRRAQGAGRVSAAGAAALAGWIAARLGHLAFSFEDLSSWMHLALVFAWIEHLAAPRTSSQPRAPSADRPLVRLCAAGACAVTSLVAFAHCCVRPGRDASRVRATLSAVAVAPRAAGWSIERIAQSGSIYRRTSVDLFSWVLLDSIPRLRRDGLGAEADDAARETFDLIAHVRAADQRDVKAAITRARLLELSPPLAADPAAAGQVRAELLAAREIAPRRQHLAFALADLELRSRRPDAAIDVLRAAIADDPRGAAAWARLAAVCRATGRLDEARRVVREARERGVPFGRDEERFLRGIEDADGGQRR